MNRNILLNGPVIDLPRVTLQTSKQPRTGSLSGTLCVMFDHFSYLKTAMRLTVGYPTKTAKKRTEKQVQCRCRLENRWQHAEIN